jgi:lipid-binding SYLF domain-containing protein
MFRLMRILPMLAVSAGLMSAAAAPARADQAAVLNQAMITVDKMKTDPMFGPSRQFLRNAKAVLIVPRLLKGGFIFGAEGGDGVMVARLGKRWSSPAFYTLGSASFGLQIGLQQARFVMFIMTDRALRAVEASKFTFGGAAGLTVISLGAGVQAATSTNLTGDIIVWSASKGAYGGLTLQGSVLAPKSNWNAQFYGRPISAPEILGMEGRNPMSRSLRTDLEGL